MSLEKYKQIKNELSTKKAELAALRAGFAQNPSDSEKKQEEEIENEIKAIEQKLADVDVSTLQDDLTNDVKTSLEKEENKKHFDSTIKSKLNVNFSGFFVVSFDLKRDNENTELKSNINFRIELDLLQRIIKVGIHYLNYESAISLNIMLLIESDKGIDLNEITADQLVKKLDKDVLAKSDSKSQRNYILDINLELYDAIILGPFRLPGVGLTASSFFANTSRTTIEKKLELINLAKTANKESKEAIEEIISKSNQNLKDKAAQEKEEAEKAAIDTLTKQNKELLENLNGIKDLMTKLNSNKK